MCSMLFLMLGCYSTQVRAEPPPWAPAHGYRAKHRHHYYPSSQVYFDTKRNLYSYYDGGKWQISAKLPGGISINVSDNIVLDMDTDKPYIHHAEIVKRYPPGLLKKSQGKKKGKNKGKKP